MKKTFTSVVIVSALLVGCAGPGYNQGYGANYRPIVDMQGVDQEQFMTDIYECQSYARQSMSTGQGAAAGAVGGAIFGALLGAALGDHNLAAQGAGVGALSGAAGGAGAAEMDQRSIVKNCLAGRGYRVLN